MFAGNAGGVDGGRDRGDAWAGGECACGDSGEWGGGVSGQAVVQWCSSRVMRQGVSAVKIEVSSVVHLDGCGFSGAGCGVRIELSATLFGVRVRNGRIANSAFRETVDLQGNPGIMTIHVQPPDDTASHSVPRRRAAGRADQGDRRGRRRQQRREPHDRGRAWKAWSSSRRTPMCRRCSCRRRRSSCSLG